MKLFNRHSTTGPRAPAPCLPHPARSTRLHCQPAGNSVGVVQPVAQLETSSLSSSEEDDVVSVSTVPSTQLAATPQAPPPPGVVSSPSAAYRYPGKPLLETTDSEASLSMDDENTSTSGLAPNGKHLTPVLRMDASWHSQQTDSQTRPFLPTINMSDLLDDLLGEPKSMPAFLAGLQNMSTVGGPVIYRPHVARPPGSADPATLPLLLYLPGIDGTGLAAYRQFPSLTAAFDLRAMFIPPSDRSSFEEIVEAARAQLESELAGGDPLRPVYLLGESFGGLVALALAQRTNAVDRIVLCNPATSFSDSIWPLAGPVLTSLPPSVYNMMPLALSPILTNPLGIALGDLRPSPLGLPPNPLDVVSTAAWGLVGLLPELGSLRSVMPPPTLAHRLQLLQQGSRAVNPTLHKVEQRVLLLVGDKDLVIPSETEGPRLKKALARCNLRVLKERSHAMLQEPGIDLVHIMQEEGFYMPRRQLTSQPRHQEGAVPQSGAVFGRPLPLELPTPKEVQRAMDEGGISLLKTLVSPVFFSTDPATGQIRRGLRHVPVGAPGRPVLFVGNHQLFAPDMPLMVAAFIQERGVVPRGLAHPMALNGPPRTKEEQQAPEQQSWGPFAFLNRRPRRNETSPTNPFGAFLKTFGGVLVSPNNLYKLLQQGETALLYPGGVREAYKYKNEEYQLFWPDKAEFVRMAARYGATIVPFGAVGAEDGVNQVLDGKELQELPVVGEWLRSQQKDIPQARRGVNAGTQDPAFIAPLITFNAPHRFYYYFGQPIETSPDMLSDRAATDAIYRQVKDTCESCISYLLHRREYDPYQDLLKRLLYEASWGGQKQAPTFEIDE